MVKNSLKDAVLAKESSRLQSSYEAAATLTEFDLKKILIDKMDKSESYLAAPEHREFYEGLRKSYDLDKTFFDTYEKVYSLKRSRKDKDKDEDPSAGSKRGLNKRKTSKDAEPTKEEPEFEVADSDMPQDQEENLECYKALLEKLDWENPKGDDYPFDLTKPLPLVMNGNRQMASVDYFFNNDLKYLQGGISTMTHMTSLTKTKAAQYDLPDIEDMVPNIWVPVKGLQSRHDVYSMKRILVATQVEEMRKHGYGYLKEIVVRRADNDLYRFKEGDFPHLRINDIKDMLLQVVQNRLTNLLGDDVFDFAIALRMFTRSLVIQERVEDLQLGVESYQKKINVTKPQTTISGIRKKDPYTPYQDPQGFIYVDNKRRNRLMRSDELYKFSDRTLTGLRTSLDDITKNIRIEYLPKRRWSTLEKKRANIMIKAIDKQLKERSLIRSLEKFIGGRHYGTDLCYFNKQYDFVILCSSS
ncbi:hypothetical protein Tco_0464330 [Tanacetum coccineum]